MPITENILWLRASSIANTVSDMDAPCATGTSSRPISSSCKKAREIIKTHTRRKISVKCGSQTSTFHISSHPPT